MEEKMRSNDRSDTFSGRGLITVEPPLSAIQEICVFLFFKLYLDSKLYPDPVWKLWQLLIPNIVPTTVQRRIAVLKGVIQTCRNGINETLFIRKR